MTLAREPILVANFNLLQQTLGLKSNGGLMKTITRRLKVWTDVPAEQCPYICQAQPSENHQWPMPALEDHIRMQLKLWIYVKVGATEVPGTLMNPILDAIQAAYGPDSPTTHKQTLGGLVKHARINGEILTSEGWLGDTEIAVVPIELYLTSLQS